MNVKTEMLRKDLRVAFRYDVGYEARTSAKIALHCILRISAFDKGSSQVTGFVYVHNKHLHMAVYLATCITILQQF